MCDTGKDIWLMLEKQAVCDEVDVALNEFFFCERVRDWSSYVERFSLLELSTGSVLPC